MKSLPVLQRNQFHPAWFLLISVGLLILTQAFERRGDELARAVAPLLLVGIGVAVWRISHRNACGFSQRIAKEIRIQLPGAMIVLLVPAIAGLIGNDFQGLAQFGYALGCALIGATAFGSEFDHQTMGNLLVHPISRTRIWGEKLGVAGAFLFCAWLGFQSSESIQGSLTAITLWIILPPLLGWCTAPILSLLTRGTFAGTILTIALPFAVALMGQLVLAQIWHWNHVDEELHGLAPGFSAYCLIVGVLYVTGAVYWGWKYFLRLEFLGTRSVPLPINPFAAPLDKAVRLFSIFTSNGTTQLLRKEFRLHVVPWFLGTLYVGLWGLLVMARQYYNSSEIFYMKYEDAHLPLAVIFSALTLVFTGAECIAEERQFGTLEWQLTLPPTIQHQWRIKAGVTFFLALVLGGLLPLLLLSAISIHVGSDFPFGIFCLLVPALALTAAGIYGSSISGNTIKAMLMAAALLVSLIGALSLLTFSDPLFLHRQQQWQDHSVVAPPWNFTYEQLSNVVIVVGQVGLLMLVAIWLRVSRRNFRLGIPSRNQQWMQWGQILGTTLGVGILFGVITVVSRDWTLRSHLLAHPYVERSDPARK